jgi:ABC-2 type transport system ATP-binding protein
MNAITARALRRTYGHVEALAGLDLDVPAGSVFGLLGPNGAGKTTTLHILLGILPPDSGKAEVLGMDVSRHGHAIRSRCGVLLEHDGLYERMTAADNLLFQAASYGVARGEAEERMRDMLAPAGLWERRHDRVGTFSRGMKRRLGVVRAFLTRPDVVFLDEPTSGLDVRAASDVRQLIKARANEGATIVVTTHDLAEAEAMCDHVAVVERGRRIVHGAPALLEAAKPPTIEFTGRFTDAHVAALQRRRSIQAVDRQGDVLTVTLASPGPAAPLVAWLVKNDAQVETVQHVKSSLEERVLRVLSEAA